MAVIMRGPDRSPRRARQAMGVLGSMAIAALISLAPIAQASIRATQPAPPLFVSGTEIVDAAGAHLQLNGVNRAGTEYACAQGWGIFDGPSDQASISAMAAWHVHAVRIPLNEDCWLGINGVNPLYGGSAYRKAIASYVSLLERNAMNPILDLHWSAPGSELALGQREMPDADHSPAFWKSVAGRFGKDQAVAFDLYNEPHDVTWTCWLHGCTVNGWRAAGMQRLVTTVRSAGATNVLLVAGLGWAGDLTEWGAHMPVDGLGRLAAAWHVYDFGACTDAACWATQVAGVVGRAPVVLGEFGETDCDHAFVDSLMTWADHEGSVGIGYLAWTWDDWPGCGGPTLITDYAGTPTTYGQGVHDHFVSRFLAHQASSFGLLR
jgi:endoglucanase